MTTPISYSSYRWKPTGREFFVPVRNLIAVFNLFKLKLDSTIIWEMAMLSCIQFVLHAVLLFLQRSAILYPAERFPE